MGRVPTRAGRGDRGGGAGREAGRGDKGVHHKFNKPTKEQGSCAALVGDNMVTYEEKRSGDDIWIWTTTERIVKHIGTTMSQDIASEGQNRKRLVLPKPPSSSQASWRFILLSLLLLLVQVSSNTPKEDALSPGNGTHLEEGRNNRDFDQIGHEGEVEGEEHESEPAQAVLFPAFTLTIGVVTFYTLSRYWAALPYTAAMFLIGALMGIGVELREDSKDHVSLSTRMWAEIDSEVLLLCFLPGLIFKDAMGLNVHLAKVAFIQIVIFAFPLVLLGMFLTGAIAHYILPHDWSWNLALTFGSILAATDPVAVAALLEEVGAPPRLKVHISGEALLNDGAAIVFYTIFSARYFHEVGEEGFGEEVGWARGFALFFRMSLGGAAIGLVNGFFILMVLYLLNRRFSREENIVEVTATAALAYLGYYVAEVVCHTSGVIATVAAGITVKFFGRAMLNDSRLLDDFWVLLEHILNTVLFSLGGAVWGNVVAHEEQALRFTAKDWGYLVLLYILMTLVRAFMFTLAYPLTARIGLKTSWKETLFQVYGGLRGAVGIALAIALDTAVRREAGEDSKYAEDTNQAFGYIGGIAFLTLVVNGTTAGPLLIKLGLAESSSIRKKMVEAFHARFKQHLTQEFVKLLTQHRFRNVNFGLVKAHVPYLADLTKAQLVEAIERHRETTSNDEYQPPYLQGVLPYLDDKDDDAEPTTMRKADSAANLLAELQSEVHKAEREKRTRNRQKRRRRKSNIQHLMAGEEPLSAQEMRTLYISILRATYEKMIDHGELVDREFLAIALEQSLEFTQDAVSNGAPLCDWKFVHVIDGSASGFVNRLKNHPRIFKLASLLIGKHHKDDLKQDVKRLVIERAMCFMAAHASAQRFAEREFQSAGNELSEAAKIVINESKEQWNQANAVLHSYKHHDVQLIVSHKFCTILLNSGAHYISKLVKGGFLKDDEAEHWVSEIEHHLDHVLSCDLDHHPGELDIDLIEDDKKFADERSSEATRQVENRGGGRSIEAPVEVSPSDLEAMFRKVGDEEGQN